MIRPSYWTDADLHTRLTADVREFYVGLWMESDDAGYVAWDIDRLGADLYPYRSLGWRRTHLPKWLVSLGTHVQLLDCGEHVLIPTLPRYQSPPKPSYQNQRAHERCVRQLAPHGTSGRHVVPAQEGGSIGREGKGIEGGARGATNGQEKSEFAEKMAAAGLVGALAK